jgi:hypothetical protein
MIKGYPFRAQARPNPIPDPLSIQYNVIRMLMTGSRAEFCNHLYCQKLPQLPSFVQGSTSPYVPPAPPCASRCGLLRCHQQRGTPLWRLQPVGQKRTFRVLLTDSSRRLHFKPSARAIRSRRMRGVCPIASRALFRIPWGSGMGK